MEQGRLEKRLKPQISVGVYPPVKSHFVFSSSGSECLPVNGWGTANDDGSGGEKTKRNIKPKTTCGSSNSKRHHDRSEAITVGCVDRLVSGHITCCPGQPMRMTTVLVLNIRDNSLPLFLVLVARIP